MTIINKNERPFTTGEVATTCHVTINAVKKWIASGKLKAFRTPGGHFRVDKNDFQDFVNKYKFNDNIEVFSNNKKVLIVDDEPQVLEFLKATLEASPIDYDIDTAIDGYDALIKVGDFSPDLLIIDIRMPRLDGVEVCKRLKSNEKTKGMKILAVTAFGSDEMNRIIKAGADKCLPKPLKTSEVQKNVERLLKQSV